MSVAPAGSLTVSTYQYWLNGTRPVSGQGGNTVPAVPTGDVEISFEALANANLPTMLPTDIAKLTTFAIHHLHADVISSLTPSQVAAFTTTQISVMNTTQVQALPATGIGALNGRQALAISTDGIAVLSGVQISGLSASSFGSLSTD